MEIDLRFQGMIFSIVLPRNFIFFIRTLWTFPPPPRVQLPVVNDFSCKLGFVWKHRILVTCNRRVRRNNTKTFPHWGDEVQLTSLKNLPHYDAPLSPQMLFKAFRVTHPPLRVIFSSTQQVGLLIHTTKHAGKFNTVFNSLSAKPWRRVREWRYSSAILDLSTRWRWVIRFTPRPLYPRERAPGTHCLGGWLSSRVCLDAVEKRKIYLPRPEIGSRPSSL
jgi:hypothetical protein